MIQTSHTWPAWWHAELDKLSFPSLKRFLFNLTYIFYCPEYRRLLPPFFKAFPQYFDLWVKCRAPGNRTAYAYDGRYESRVGGNLLARRTAGSTPTRKMVEIMSRLDFRENCEDLFIWDLCCPEESLVAFLLSANPQRPVFPKMKHFGAYIADDPNGCLSVLLPSTLSSLYLGFGPIIDGPGPWFDMITYFQALHSLPLMTNAGFLDTRTSSLLGRLHSLRSLVIVDIGYDTQYRWGIDDGFFTDDDIEAMTSGLPLLQHFELGMAYNFSLPSLTSLATNCPGLKSCHLSLLVPITAWGAQEAPNFPHLENFILNPGEYVDKSGVTEHESKWSGPSTKPRPTIRLMDAITVNPTHVDIVLRHCPRLEKLHSYLKDYGKEEIEQRRQRMARSA